MIFRKFSYPRMFRLLGSYSNFLCKRYVNEFSDFRKIIKSSYLRAQKELWELPLHRYIRNGLLMCLKVFLDCLGTIWTLFFNKTIKISGLITCQVIREPLCKFLSDRKFWAKSLGLWTVTFSLLGVRRRATPQIKLHGYPQQVWVTGGCSRTVKRV